MHAGDCGERVNRAAIVVTPARLSALILGLVTAVLLTSCTSTPTASGPGGGSASSAAAVSKASITVNPGAGARGVRPSDPVSVVATNGKLTSVVVKAAGGAPLSGSLSADQATWTATSSLLPLSTSFVVVAQAVDPDGRAKTLKSTFSTVRPTGTLKAVWSAGPQGKKVGVGMPILVAFSSPVTDKAAVERQMAVSLSIPIEGSWHWFSDKSVHWRPKTFWPAGEQVSVTLGLRGIDAGNGVWGTTDYTFGYNIGSSMISTVDVTRHTMTVTESGRVLRVIPITTGKPGYATRGGIKVIMTQETSRVMDSTTVDIPKSSPDAYHLTVKYAQRLTWSGEFLHAAPWSVGSQGHANVSHGCTGMSDANAIWLFGVSKIGDVVSYVHSARPLEQGNGWTDWNLTWSAWQAGSALA